MTISTVENRKEYAGNDVATSFSFPYYFVDEEDLTVVLTDISGVETTLVLDTDYTVTGAGEEAGGSVSYPISGDPLATGETLTLTRIMVLDQETALKNQGTYFLAAVEAAIDKLAMIDQQLQTQIDDLDDIAAGEHSHTVPLAAMGMSDNTTESTILTQDAWHMSPLMSSRKLIGWTYEAGLVAPFTALADAGGGLITVTSVAHGFSDGDYITIVGSNDNNDAFVIQGATTDTYQIEDTFVATDTGTAIRGTVLIAGEDTEGTYFINGRAYVTAATNNQKLRFGVFKNADLVQDSAGDTRTQTATEYSTFAAPGIPVDIVEGDRISGALMNESGTSNVTVKGGGISLSRISPVPS